MTPYSDADNDPWVGRLIDTRYRILEQIGRGGMGTVYRVEHQRMGKIAALKMLNPELVANREAAHRFQTEARAISRLTHPNAVQVFDFGKWEKMMYLVMEYVRGQDLGTVLTRSGTISFAKACPMFVQICGALSEAHEHGIVHRDIKPENLLITRTRAGRDRMKVVDFGLALLTEAEERPEITADNMIVGTPYYMSPEQIHGHEVDGRSDLYSLGAVIYKTLVGNPPFQAATPIAVLTKHLTEAMVPPSKANPNSDLNEHVDRLLSRAMAKDAEERFADAAEFASALTDCLDEQVPTETPPETPSVEDETMERRVTVPVTEPLSRAEFLLYERRMKRQLWMRAVLWPLLFIGVTAGGFLAYRWNQEKPREIEREPNDGLTQATHVRSGKTVHGRLSPRPGLASDKDFFRIRLGQSPTKSKIQATITGIAGVDHALTIYNRSGTLLYAADNVGVGGAESVTNYRVDGEEAFLAVLPSKLAPPEQTESTAVEYTLTITAVPISLGEELEPNNTDSDASSIAPGKSVKGYLGQFDDIDYFRFSGPSGRYTISFRGAGDTAVKGLSSGTVFFPGDEIALEAGATFAITPVEIPTGRVEASWTVLPYELLLTPM